MTDDKGGSALGSWHKSAVICVSLLGLFFVSDLAFCQGVGAVLGSITDPRGAAISGARVTATHIDTQVAHSPAAGAAGTYAIPNLPVGRYQIMVEASGFERAIADRITLDVSQQREVDFRLRLPSIKEMLLLLQIK